MQYGKASSAWRYCSINFIIVMFLVTRVRGVADGSNSALNQPVAVSPANATCGAIAWDIALGDHNNTLTCVHGCFRNFSQRKEFSRFPGGVQQLGGERCLVQEIARQSMQLRREVSGHMCYLTRRERDISTYTYSIWIKPTDTKSKQCIIGTDEFDIMIRDGHVDCVIQTTGVPAATQMTTIQPDIWTHIAVRVDSPKDIMVFVNGVFQAPLIKLSGFMAENSHRTILLGVPMAQSKYARCDIMEHNVCSMEGHSILVSPNRSPDSAKFLDRVLNNNIPCEGKKDTDTVVKFACAWAYQVCLLNGSTLPPCRSFCTAMLDNSCGGFGPLNVSCDSFPDSNDPNICIDRNYKSEVQFFTGSVREGQFYRQLLTGRVIEALYIGHLRQVRALSVCLCTDEYPILHVNDSNVCVSPDPSKRYFIRRLRKLGDGRPQRYLAEYINDGDVATRWASPSSFSGSATVQIDFSHLDQLRVMKIHLSSYFPRLGIVIMARNTGAFRIVQKLSINCVQTYSLSSDGTLEYPVDVNCLNLTRLVGGISNPPYTIVVDFLMGRPHQSIAREHYSTTPSFLATRRRRAVREVSVHESLDIESFLSAKAIRVVFEGTPYKGGSSHIVSEIEVFRRNTCGCYPEGTINGSLCLDGVCQCRPVAGVDTRATGPKCRPFLTRVVPTFGPRSGGTKVVIFGGFFGRDNSSVSVRTWVDDIPFNVEYRNDTRVYSVTPPLTSATEHVLNVPTELDVTLENGYKLRTKMKFIYKEDPVIESIEPERSFISGGIQQTIIGRHMDSVAIPVLTVTTLYRGRPHKQTRSVCTVHNSTAIYCPTPNIELPLDGIAKVNQYDRNTGSGNDERARRSASSKRPVGLINSEDLQFYMGLVLDGVPTYRNISEVLPSFGKLDVYIDPTIYLFKKEIRLFRQYSPYNDKTVVIMGDRLNFGCKAGDYNISIGEGYCHVIDLQTNQLVCQAPQSKPKIGLFSKDGAHRVKVNVGNIKIVLGYLRYEDHPAASNALRNGIIVAVCMLVLLVLAVLLGVFVYWKRRRMAQWSGKHESLPTVDFDALQQRVGMPLDRPRDVIKALNPSLAAMVETSQIDSNRMKLGKIIGEGNFGEVYIGELQDKDDKTVSEQVAIKTVKDSESVRSVSEFLEEATIMHNFNHPNVVSLLGVVINDGKPYVIMPLMEHGDLRTFIGKRERSFTVRDLLEFGHQVAKGMAYLEDARFVHRDLAARNCMVDQKRTVKIADFGLARDIYTEDYYRVVDKYRPLPVKWMALESLQHSKFTSKSDVWSYGVVLFELMTRGEKPYCHIDNVDLKRYLEMGRRLEKPEVTPQCIYNLMMQCWLENPGERPSFANICKTLEEIIFDDVDTKDHDYVNDYLAPVQLASEKLSPKGYVPMVSGPMRDLLDTSTAQRPSPEALLMSDDVNGQPLALSMEGQPPSEEYLPMSGDQNDRPEVKVKPDDTDRKEQLLDINGTTDSVLEV